MCNAKPEDLRMERKSKKMNLCVTLTMHAWVLAPLSVRQCVTIYKFPTSPQQEMSLTALLQKQIFFFEV